MRDSSEAMHGMIERGTWEGIREIDRQREKGKKEQNKFVGGRGRKNERNSSDTEND